MEIVLQKQNICLYLDKTEVKSLSSIYTWLKSTFLKFLQSVWLVALQLSLHINLQQKSLIGCMTITLSQFNSCEGCLTCQHIGKKYKLAMHWRLSQPSASSIQPTPCHLVLLKHVILGYGKIIFLKILYIMCNLESSKVNINVPISCHY